MIVIDGGKKFDSIEELIDDMNANLGDVGDDDDLDDHHDGVSVSRSRSTYDRDQDNHDDTHGDGNGDDNTYDNDNGNGNDGTYGYDNGDGNNGVASTSHLSMNSGGGGDGGDGDATTPS